jgi:hypothetical protein
MTTEIVRTDVSLSLDDDAGESLTVLLDFNKTLPEQISGYD